MIESLIEINFHSLKKIYEQLWRFIFKPSGRCGWRGGRGSIPPSGGAGEGSCCRRLAWLPGILLEEKGKVFSSWKKESFLSWKNRKKGKKKFGKKGKFLLEIKGKFFSWKKGKFFSWKKRKVFFWKKKKFFSWKKESFLLPGILLGEREGEGKEWDCFNVRYNTLLQRFPKWVPRNPRVPRYLARGSSHFHKN